MLTDTSSRALVGRDVELAVVHRLLDDVHAGGRALVVRGEAGIGKSALLSCAVERAGELGMQVLSAAGAPSERQLPFAGLHSLVAPVLDRAVLLPAPQRHALLGAVGVVDGDAPSVFRIGLAVLTLLAEGAAERPLLVCVDDLQWFDRPSAEVLLFVARRLSADAVVLLGAVREGWQDVFRDADVPRLDLGRLSAAEGRHLLDGVAPHLDDATRATVLDAAAGNPLALHELPLTLAGAGLPPAGWVPLNERLERAFAGRLRELHPPTRALLLAAALHSGGDLPEVAAAAAAVDRGADLAALPPAVAAGLVHVVDGAVRFRHPLVRSAVHQAAETHERIAMHRALASVSAHLPEQQLWHRVAGALGPDDGLARELADVAQQYQRRGAPETAVTALEAAASLTVDGRLRGHYLVRAAGCALQLGRAEQALELLRRAEDGDVSARDAPRLQLTRWAACPPAPGDASALHAVLRTARGAAAGGDRDTAVELLLVAGRAVSIAGREQTSGAEVLSALDDVGDRADDVRGLLVRAYATPLAGDSDVVDRVTGVRTHELHALDDIVRVAKAALWVHAADAATPFLDQAVDGLRRRGDLPQLAEILVLRGWTHFYLGGWESGLTDVDEGLRLSREARRDVDASALDVLRAMLLALLGREVAFQPAMAAAERVGLQVGGAVVLNIVQLARGLVAMATGAHDAATDQLLRMYDPQDPACHRNHGGAYLTYLAEAAAHSGRVDEARAVLADVEQLVGPRGAAQLQASVRHARAVLADDDVAEPLYREALAGDLGAWPLDRARLDLAWGMWLRRRRRAAESREPLRRARDAFDRIGAVTWAEQARRELRASGERSRGATPSPWEALTPQELQIAQLAARGLSNREIAQQVFASHRTVASHLYRIFPKVGVTSRQQLAHVLATAAG